MGQACQTPRTVLPPKWCSATWLSPWGVARGKDTWLGPPTQACGASLGQCLWAKGSSDPRPLWSPCGLLLEPPGVHGDLAKGHSRATSPEVSTWAQGVRSRPEVCPWPTTLNPMANDFLSWSASCWVNPGDNSRWCWQAFTPSSALPTLFFFLNERMSRL